MFSFIFDEYDTIKCFKKSVVGYIVGWTPNISVVSSILSVGNPSFSVVLGIYCQFWVSHSNPYPYPRKFSCSCMYIVLVENLIKFGSEIWELHFEYLKKSKSQSVTVGINNKFP